MASVESSSVLHSVMKSTSSLIIVQILYRIFTFIANAIILRYISSEVLGIINVRLGLLFSTAYFISVESFRRAALGVSEPAKWRQALNLVWLSVPVSAVVSAALAWVWLHLLSQPDASVTSEYRLGVVATAAGVVVEMVAQPLAILAQAMLFVKLKVFTDMSVMCTRVLLKVALIVVYPESPIWAYCVSDGIGTLLLVAVYVLAMTRHVRSQHNCLPVTTVRQLGFLRPPGEPTFDAEQVVLTWSFFKQGLLKQLLTEGERYLMTVFHMLDFAEQGLYDVVANLGSLAARFIFQPIEENAYVFFSRTVERGKPVSSESGSVLRDLLRGMSLLGLIVVTFGWGYSHLLLHCYGGARLSGSVAVQLLRAQAGYVLLLAVNGILECFTFAVMREQELNTYNRQMVVLSCVFVGATWLFTRLFGGVGFVLANCVNMVARIVVCWRYVSGCRRQGPSPLAALAPPAPVAAALLLSAALTATSERHLYPSSAVAHLAVGAVCGVVVLAAALYSEPRLLALIRTRLLAKRKPA